MCNFYIHFLHPCRILYKRLPRANASGHQLCVVHVNRRRLWYWLGAVGNKALLPQSVLTNFNDVAWGHFNVISKIKTKPEIDENHGCYQNRWLRVTYWETAPSPRTKVKQFPLA